MTSLFAEPLRGVLDRLHAGAERDDRLEIPPVPDDASDQDKLLAYCGRTP